MDPRCAEVYFFYGSALLELARIENTVLGNALSGVPEENEPINDSRYGNPEEVAAEEKEEIAEKVIDAMTETPEEVKAEETKTEEAKTEETKTEEAKTEEVEKKEETTTTTEETKKEGEDEAEEENGDEEDDEETGEEVEGDKEKEDGEDVSNLQMSWEMFELAKVIYSKETEADKKKRVAECMLKLGEIGIEQELYTQAIGDITESIRMQEEATERDERMLAESYYQLGMARQFNNMFVEANESYQRSINIVQLCIDKLKGKLATLEQAENKTDVELEMNSLKDEIGELEALLPEMQSKLEEVSNEQRNMTEAALKELKEAKEIFTTNAGFENGANNGDVKDITCMVKSKRKIDSCDETSTKKTRLSGEGTVEEESTATVEAIKSDDDKENKIEETTTTTTECTTAPATTTETEAIIA